MSVEMKRIFSRVAGCCALAIFVAAGAPSTILADEFAPPPRSEIGEGGILCMDDMLMDPYTDELEPSPVSLSDAGCSISQLPVST